jgi:hypothetical protein
MRTPSRLAWLVLTGLCAVAGTARAGEPSEEPRAKQLGEAVQKGVSFLKGTQQNGSWDNWGGYVTVVRQEYWTSLAVLALLESGAKPDDAVVAKGLEILRHGKSPIWPDGRSGLTDVVSVHAQALCRADPKKDRDLIQHDVDTLLSYTIRKGDQLLGWSHGTWDWHGVPPPISASNNGGVVVALHAASQAGARVPEQIWKDTRACYLRTQNPDGGWSEYPTDKASTAIITCVGISGLLITAKELHLQGDEHLRPVLKAVDYLTGHFSVEKDGDCGLLYALAGVREEADKDLPAAQQEALRVCYQKGVEFLLKEQAKDGSWGGVKNGAAPPAATSFNDRYMQGLAQLASGERRVIATCRGLIFLAEMRRQP